MFSPGQRPADAQDHRAGATLTTAGSPHDTHPRSAVVDFPAGQRGTTLPPTTTMPMPPDDASAATHVQYGLLAVLAASLDDIERTRIATENRIRALGEQGFGDSPFEKRLTGMLDGLQTLEHRAILDLQRAMRLHPLHEFVKRTRGLGEKQAARLLAAIGNPADRENPAKLWQYAGHGDPLRSKKRRGQTVEFNPTAKMRVHLCAESLLRAGNRDVYDRERAKWADREASDGHKHNHALRVVGKELLKDIWKFSKEATS